MSLPQVGDGLLLCSRGNSILAHPLDPPGAGIEHIKQSDRAVGMEPATHERLSCTPSSLKHAGKDQRARALRQQCVAFPCNCVTIVAYGSACAPPR